MGLLPAVQAWLTRRVYHSARDGQCMNRMGSELAPSTPRSIAVLCVASEAHECIEEGAESEGISV